MNNKGDLISRSALKDKLTDTINPNDIAKNEWYEGYAACVQVLSDLIDNAPTVAVNCKDCDGYEAGYSAGLKDAERPKGEWIAVYSDLDYEEYQCSICGRVVIIYKNVDKKELLERYPFCHCGAKMKGGTDMRGDKE